MITNRQLGVILILIGLLVTVLTFVAKAKEDFYIEELIKAHDGECILENDYCLHNDRDLTGYIVAWVVGVSSVLLGVYLLFFERSYAHFQQEQAAFTRQLSESKSKETFAAYLAAFTPEEQAVLRAVQEQEGIKQATLRFRTGMSKASLSLLLNSLEERDVISRKVVGKTKEVYLRRKF